MKGELGLDEDQSTRRGSGTRVETNVILLALGHSSIAAVSYCNTPSKSGSMSYTLDAVILLRYHFNHGNLKNSLKIDFILQNKSKF